MHTHSDQFNGMAFPTIYQSMLGLLFMMLFGQAKQNKDFMNVLFSFPITCLMEKTTFLQAFGNQNQINSEPIPTHIPILNDPEIIYTKLNI